MPHKNLLFTAVLSKIILEAANKYSAWYDYSLTLVFVPVSFTNISFT